MSGGVGTAGDDLIDQAAAVAAAAHHTGTAAVAGTDPGAGAPAETGIAAVVQIGIGGGDSVARSPAQATASNPKLVPVSSSGI